MNKNETQKSEGTHYVELSLEKANLHQFTKPLSNT